MKTDGPPVASLTIGRLHYDGGGDWYANPSSLPNLLTALRERTTLPVAEREPVIVRSPRYIIDNRPASRAATTVSFNF